MKTRGVSIRSKLIRLITVITATSLCIVFTVLFFYEAISYREDSTMEMNVLANILATNSSAALAFEDEDAGREILSAVKADRLITAAILFKENGDVFASFVADSSAEQLRVFPVISEFEIKGNKIEGAVPIILGEKKLGTLYMRRSTQDIEQRLLLYTLIASSVIVVCFILTYLLSKRLERNISDPLIALSNISTQVSQHHDYSVRATGKADGEIGQLNDAFNIMLSKIELQNNEIQKHTQELEVKIDERTRELQKRNADLEEFAYVASHDLQEPLRKVLLFTDRLNDELVNKNESVARYMDKIDHAARRMSNLIRDVLAYSRLSRLEESFIATDLNDVLTQVRIDLELYIEEKQAVISWQRLPVVRGNTLQLNQLFSNLISNALKFCDDKPRVQISCELAARDEIRSLGLSHDINGYAKIQVIDNGIGFDPQYSDKAFTLFQRLHQDKKYEGTGIGLAICRKIVLNHNGSIGVTSTPHLGTTFTIFLPIQSM